MLVVISSVRAIAIHLPSGDSDGLRICHFGMRECGTRAISREAAVSGVAARISYSGVPSTSVRSATKYTVVPSEPITVPDDSAFTGVEGPPPAGTLNRLPLVCGL